LSPYTLPLAGTHAGEKSPVDKMRGGAVVGRIARFDPAGLVKLVQRWPPVGTPS